MAARRTKLSKEHLESNSRRYWSPRDIDFEFYKLEHMFSILYFGEKDVVYVVSVDGSVFHALVRGMNLSANPFGGSRKDMTPKFIWQIIAAYCRTYGTAMTRESAEQRLATPYFLEEGVMRRGKPAVRMSQSDLKKYTDTGERQYIAEMKRTGTIENTPEKEVSALKSCS